MKLWSRSLIAGQSTHGPEHGAIAAESADEIGDRFGEKDAGDAQPADLRQNDRQRHDDDDLAEEREKRRLLALAESDEGALADGLKCHEEKSEEKYVEHRHAFGEQFGIRIENVHDRPRQHEDDGPTEKHVGHGDRRGETNDFADAADLARAVVVADDWLRSVGESVQRQRDNVAHRIDDGHDADVNIAAVNAEHIVRCNLDDAVGRLHDKTGDAEPRDLADGFALKTRAPHAQSGQRFSSAEKRHDPDHRHKLADDRGDGCAADAQAKSENKNWIENDIDDGANEDGEHACASVALRVDETVHPRREHDERCADEINAQIFGAVGIGHIAGAEKIEDRLHKKIAEEHHKDRRQAEHDKGVFHITTLSVDVVLAARDGIQRHAAGAKKIGERHDDGDDRKGQPETSERHRGCAWQMTDVDAVDKIVRHLHKLAEGHRNGEIDDVARNAADRKIIFRTHLQHLPS